MMASPPKAAKRSRSQREEETFSSSSSSAAAAATSTPPPPRSQRQRTSEDGSAAGSPNKKHDPHWTRTGSVVSLRLENFMTYSDHTIRFGPTLNLIIGPNGSGKSAITCGLILGLGGEPRDTGRTNSLASYIKHGHLRAKIKLTLVKLAGESNLKFIVIERTIERRSHRDEKATSKWSISNREADLEQIRQFINLLNIKTDNLCQFLPQERVAEFVKLKKTDLLESTLKAINDIGNIKDLAELKDLSRQLQDVLRRIAVDQQKFDQDKKKYNDQRDEIDKINRYKDLEREVKNLQLKIPYMTLRALGDSLESDREAIKAMGRLLEARRSTTKPLRDSCTRARNEMEATRKSDVSNQAAIGDSLGKLKSHREAGDKLSRDIGQLCSDLRRERDFKSSLEAKILDRQAKSRDLHKNLASLEDASRNQDDIGPLIAAKRQERSDKLAEFQRVHLKAEEVENKINDLRAKGNAVARQKTALENVRQKQKSLLRERHPEAARALEWLENNHRRFEGRVFSPIFLNISPSDPRYSRYIESAVANRDLVAFVCTNARDLKLLTGSLQRECGGLTVNVILFDRPVEGVPLPRPSGNDVHKLKSYGVDKYLIDLFEAPPEIKHYLCETYRLQETPLCSPAAANYSEELMASGVRRYYTAETLFNSIRSKYDGAVSTARSQFGQAVLLANLVDTGRIRECQDRLTQFSAEIDQLTGELQRLKGLAGDIRAQAGALVNEINQLQQAEMSIKTIRQEIQKIQGEIDAAKVKLPNISANEVRLRGKIVALGRKRAENFQRILIFTDELNRLLAAKATSSLQLKKASHAYQKLAGLLNEQEKEFKSLEEGIRDRERDVQRSAVDFQKKKDEFAKTHFPLECVPPEIGRIFATLPATVEELKASLHVKKMQLDSTGTSHVDMVAFKLLEKRIQKYQADISQRKSKEEEIRGRIDERKPRWLTGTTEYIRRISQDFGRLMDEMKYAGEVSLRIPADPNEFESYGIDVRVRFRARETLKELGDVHQSGGERSVATMLYMIALQRITNLPFRVVDEINQGMDEHNEKAVFDYIVDTAGDNDSQYLLISPKLLPNLKYTKKMCIHILHNAPTIKYTKFPKAKFSR